MDETVSEEAKCHRLMCLGADHHICSGSGQPHEISVVLGKGPCLVVFIILNVHDLYASDISSQDGIEPGRIATGCPWRYSGSPAVERPGGITAHKQQLI